MRKLVAITSALVALLVGLVAAPDLAAGAGATDVSASVSGAPTAVSPVGGRVVYEVVFANEGALPVVADYSDTTSNGKFIAAGSTIPAGCTTPTNGVQNPVITCNTVPMAAGAQLKLYVAILTPTTATTTSNTASAGNAPLSAGIPVVDGDLANNTDSVSTPVFNDPNSSSSYLAEGDSLTYKTHKITVRSSDTGVIVDLRDAPAAGRFCGAGTLCADGLRINFPLNDIYSADDIEVKLNFGKGGACRSTTNDPCTDPIYYVGPSGGAPVEVVNCTSAPSAPPVPVPCVRSRVKVDGQLYITVGINSDDPDLLPQGLKLVG
jgi:hypothetical protein